MACQVQLWKICCVTSVFYIILFVVSFCTLQQYLNPSAHPVRIALSALSSVRRVGASGGMKMVLQCLNCSSSKKKKKNPLLWDLHNGQGVIYKKKMIPLFLINALN